MLTELEMTPIITHHHTAQAAPRYTVRFTPRATVTLIGQRADHLAWHRATVTDHGVGQEYTITSGDYQMLHCSCGDETPGHLYYGAHRRATCAHLRAYACYL